MHALKRHFARIDARSLGLFRIAMAIVLLGDLFARWKWVRAFYTNEGVLPNHVHLFNVRDTGRIWSFFHAFSNVDEGNFAFSIVLVVYVLFLVGFKTRSMHALSLASLVSLTARNPLLENAGNYAALALLAFTMFLPLGSRYSLDSLRRTYELRDEHTGRDLNRYVSDAAKWGEFPGTPGYSPTSLAAFGALAQIAIIFACSALAHRASEWKSGDALYFALHIDRLSSPLGQRIGASLSPAALRALTNALHASEYAIPGLLLAGGLHRWFRFGASALVAIYGLFLGMFFSFGLYGWTLCAAAALVIPSEAWDRKVLRHRSKKTRAVIYDSDCGMCLWLSRLVRRLDGYDNLRFVENAVITGSTSPGLPFSDASDLQPLPETITPELVQETIVVVDRTGRVSTRARAVADILEALPLGGFAAGVLRIPGVRHVCDLVYNAIASRRSSISELCGLQVCGVTTDESSSELTDVACYEAPAARTKRRVMGSLRETAAAILFVSVVAQTARANAWPTSITLPQPRLLYATIAWTRLFAKWDILADLPQSNDRLVIDAQTRAGQSIDLLTGESPAMDRAHAKWNLGQLWRDYLERIRQPEWADYQRTFRDYLGRGGSLPQPLTDPIAGYDAYWVKEPTVAPKSSESAGPVETERLFSHLRGGKFARGVQQQQQQQQRIAPHVPLDFRRP